MSMGLLTTVLYAQEKKHEIKNRTTGNKEIEGEVTWIGKNKIAITYNKDQATGTEYEILIPYDIANLTFEHRNNMGEIKVGDTVRVQYEEETLEYDDGNKNEKIKAKVISFVRPSTQKPKAQTLSQEEEEALPLKGIK